MVSVFAQCPSSVSKAKADWRLYQVFRDVEDYLSNENTAILSSEIDSIEDLINYLEKHNGFIRRW